MATAWLLPEFFGRATAGRGNGKGSSVTTGTNDVPVAAELGRSGKLTATASGDPSWHGTERSREETGGAEVDIMWRTSPHPVVHSDRASSPKIDIDQSREDEADLTVQILDCCADVGERLRELVIEKRTKEGACQLGYETDTDGENVRGGGRSKVSRGTQSGGPRVSRGTQSCPGVLHHVEDYMEDVYGVAEVLTDPNASETKILESLIKLESLPISTAVLEYLLALRHCRLERCPSGDMWLCCWPWAQDASPKTKTK